MGKRIWAMRNWRSVMTNSFRGSVRAPVRRSATTSADSRSQVLELGHATNVFVGNCVGA